ncbi:sarcosine oxidase subunit alpha family protein [Pseudomonas sp. P115]|uniref:sarcosine oxidase subunit alpha family protein n=1 Tax=Pseudomonas pisciculturae TaxID=2730413 RepID=UPI0018921EA8|nr:sarcosine oxidase subunit alpha family protein [Pseudomonas pisciculturae]MBF6029818.1 sarcosine oxidase subunit alpha family protein [Pseudomonas pisciculturae]
MTQLNRLAVPGAAAKVINFEFDGKPYQGRTGDTLAAALMANGVKIVGRSFKLHRPRGLMGSWVEEVNGLVQLESGGFAEPNVRATMVMLYEGLTARGQNAWPNVQHDLLGVMDRFSRLLPASFYYKSMIWPTWHFYERFVRPIAGLGKAPTERDVQNYQKQNLHCDLLICGGGPAGIAAALAAADSGLRVVLADDQETFGGSLRGERLTIDNQPATDWVARSIATLAAQPNVRLLPATNVSGYYENNFLVASQRLQTQGPVGTALHKPRERLWRIHAKEVILAAGALERPLICPNNDRPGVMLASAVRHYANRFGVVAGEKVVVVTNNDSAYRTALDLAALGVRSITLVDTRRSVDSRLREQLAAQGIVHVLGQGVRDIKGTKCITAVQLAAHSGTGQLDNSTQLLECDVLALSSGWTPTIHLHSQSGGSLRYDEPRACLVPGTTTQPLTVVGAANGQMTLQECLDEGYKAGADVARKLKPGVVIAARSWTACDEALASAIEPFWFTRSEPTDKQWVDFQYDVKVSDLELAVRENFVSVEHVKRYTTGGMSVDQGKSSNFNILAILAQLTGKPIEKVGTTKFRPPYQPVTLGAFAGPTVGEGYAPWQTLPAHDWHVRHGAKFGDYGWQRPDYYPRGNEDIHAATLREVTAARTTVGMFDGSPLGKIQVTGPDAAAFLDRLYVNTLSSLKVGFARYAMLTNENGVLIDDGVIIRMADTMFLVHATSGAVGRVALMMEEYLQCEWPDLQVHISNITTQWGNLTLSGPLARQVMEQLDCGIDLSAQQFGHMQYREGAIDGVAVRVLRASFTGDVTFEIGVPARYTEALWDKVFEAGATFGITPYGVEALEVMRTEKGYIHVGSDTDACSNPLDLGMARVIERKAVDFIGRRSLQRQAEQAADRLQFVGLEPDDPQQRLPVGGHVVERDTSVAPMASHGYVTSAVFSPTLGKHIGLGIVRRGASRLNEQVFIYSNGKIIAARIVSPAHFDPKGERLNG